MSATARPHVPSQPEFVELWSLLPETQLELPGSGGAPAVRGRWGRVPLPNGNGTLASALERMSYGPVRLSNLVAAPSRDAERVGTEVHRLEGLLSGVQNLVVRTLATAPGVRLLSVLPVTRDSRFRPAPPAPGAVHRLSRYAVLRGDGAEMSVESPLSAQRVVLHGTEGVWLLGCFLRPATVAETAARMGAPADLVRTAVGYLSAAGMLVEGAARADGSAPEFAEDSDPALAAWSAHELMVHARGLPEHAHAGELPGGRSPVRWAGDPIVLEHPRLADVLAADPPFTVVLESRRSVRDHGERVPTRGELAELLYRAARVRAVVAGGAHGQLTNRPYPSAGAAYPLELYPVVGRGSGLERGIYHYDPVGHTVRRTGAGEEAVRDLLDQARQSAGLDGEPPLVLMVIARFDRMSARHGGSPYSGLLADVGALVQTLYLVATAMGLAPCALADGTVRLEARALGLDWRRESPVGGFVLGSVPRGSAGEPPPGSNTVPVNGPDWAETCHLLLRPLRERRAAAAGASTG